MNSIGFIKDTIMRAKGFEKTALKDTKGVLTKADNYKWVKNYSTDKSNITMQVFPSGTIVQDIFETNTIRKQKMVIKPDKSGIDSLRDFGNTEGSYNIASVKKFKNIGNILPYEPVYKPLVFGETLALRSAKEAKNNLSKNIESVKAQTKKRREKFVADFNEQYYRKTIKGKDGSKSKYVIDKESGKIVRFFRKNKKGEALIGRILYSNPSSKKINVVSPQAFIHKEITNYPKGRLIQKTTITLDGYAKNDQYIVSKNGKLKFPNIPSVRDKYINRILKDGIK